jgi:hypothetical protein
MVDDEFVNGDFEFVELGIFRFDGGGDLFIALDQGAYGQGEVAIGQAGHHEKGLADIRDLLGGRTVGKRNVGGGCGHGEKVKAKVKKKQAMGKAEKAKFERDWGKWLNPFTFEFSPFSFLNRNGR